MKPGTGFLMLFILSAGWLSAADAGVPEIYLEAETESGRFDVFALGQAFSGIKPAGYSAHFFNSAVESGAASAVLLISVKESGLKPVRLNDRTTAVYFNAEVKYHYAYKNSSRNENFSFTAAGTGPDENAAIAAALVDCAVKIEDRLAVTWFYPKKWAVSDMLSDRSLVIAAGRKSGLKPGSEFYLASGGRGRSLVTVEKPDDNFASAAVVFSSSELRKGDSLEKYSRLGLGTDVMLYSGFELQDFSMSLTLRQSFTELFFSFRPFAEFKRHVFLTEDAYLNYFAEADIPWHFLSLGTELVWRFGKFEILPYIAAGPMFSGFDFENNYYSIASGILLKYRFNPSFTINAGFDKSYYFSSQLKAAFPHSGMSLALGSGFRY
jgi:hypothetical protein